MKLKACTSLILAGVFTIFPLIEGVTMEGNVLAKCRTKILRPHPATQVTAYLGTWHPLQFAPTRAHQAARGTNLGCLAVNISKTEHVNILNYDEEWRTQLSTGVYSDLTRGQGKVAIKPESPLVWSVEYGNGTDEKQTAQVVVLATTENSWSVEYHCAIRNSEIEERIVLLGRNRQVESLAHKIMAIIMYSLGIPTQNLVIFNQFRCPL